MQFIKCSDLKAGMRLAKPIFNKNGTLLFERDAKLPASSIDSIRHFGLPGLYILEPAEPVPPLSEEDMEFERFQTVTMFQLKEDFALIRKETKPKSINAIAQTISQQYGNLDHKFNFIQNLRSSDDFIYKHSLNVAILCAMLAHELNLNAQHKNALIYAGLLHDIGLDIVTETAPLKKPSTEPALETLTPLDEEDRLYARYHDSYNKRLQGYYMLKADYNPFDLPASSLAIIHQHSQALFHPKLVEMPRLASSWSFDTKVLQVANTFDMLTAMREDDVPMSFLSAVRYLKEHPRNYDPSVVAALANCLHILPVGACVDLNTNEKAVVVFENSSDFDAPIVIRFDDMQVLDLGNPKVAKQYSISDNMRTMDNRIQIDEQTLKLFFADDPLIDTTSRIKGKLYKKL